MKRKEIPYIPNSELSDRWFSDNSKQVENKLKLKKLRKKAALKGIK